MDNKRDQWGSKLGFILAAIGSAVGLGNIWRFPYLVYENGGGAFLVPYFFAIFTAGIPLLILEYGMGHKFRGSTPLALARANKKWEWLGWWPSITAFFILGYYSMILSWAMKYFTLSFNKGWGNDTNAYFYNDFLRLTDSPFQFGSVIWPVLIGILLVWGISWFICYRGVKGGIEKLNKILLPTLVAIMVIIAIRGVTLEGATLGLNKLFTPDWSKVMEPKVWIAAYGQVFYSLSLAMGIMIPYITYKVSQKEGSNYRFLLANFNTFVLETVLGKREILQFSQQEKRFEQMMDHQNNLTQTHQKLTKHQSFQQILSDGLIILSIVISILLIKNHVWLTLRPFTALAMASASRALTALSRS